MCWFRDISCYCFSMYLFFVHPLELQRTQESCTVSVAHAKENNSCGGVMKLFLALLIVVVEYFNLLFPSEIQ